MSAFEDYCHLQELFGKTTVTFITVIVRIERQLSFTRTLLEDHSHSQLQGLLCQNWKTTVIYKNSLGRPLLLSKSTSGTLMLELEDYCHLQELFWKTTDTVISVIVRIGRLLSVTSTLLEDHSHY